MKYILFFLLFLLPVFARAEVIISEISWMGNSSSANAEWIELKNTGASPVNLSGWTLRANDGTPSVNLSGTIQAGSYALLERSNDSTVPGVTALVIYTGALGNDGEHLILRDGNGNIIQSLDFSSGWPAGNNTTKETMQWNGSVWITAEPTPGTLNAMFDSGTTGSQGTGTGGQEEVSSQGSDGSGSGGATAIVYGTKEEKIRYEKEFIEIRAVNTNVPVGTPVKISLFTRDLDGSDIVRGNFFWNMGDGTEFIKNKNEKFEHVYEHEGSYVITVRYHSSYFEGIDPNATSRLTVNVGSSGVIVSNIHFDGGVELRNITGLEIDLSDWSLNNVNGQKFVIPKGTYILPGKTIVFNPRQTNMNPQSVILLNPIGKFVSSREKFPANYPAKNTTSLGSSKNSSPNVTSSGSSIDNKTTEENISLNERLSANSSNAIKQKQPSAWMIVFVVLIISVCVFVFFLYKKEENNNKDDIKEEDEFELID